MLYDNGGQNEQQLLAAIEAHVLPHLRISDAQALGQTCRRLRTLVHSHAQVGNSTALS